MKSFILYLTVTILGIVPLMAQNTHDNHSTHIAPFIENKGQWDNDLLFRADFKGGRIFMQKDKLRFGFLNHDDLEIIDVLYHDKTERGKELLDQQIIHGHIYEMEFVDANKNPQVSSFERQAKFNNYFIGNDRSKWAGKVGLFGQVLYQELWNGIDFKIKEEYGIFEYDFIVKPGADAEQIKLKFDGQSNIEIKEGKLVITTSVNTVIEDVPFVYQQIDGKQHAVSCLYKLEDGYLTFEFPEGFDNNYILIVDPTLIFATYSGSTSDNYGFTATFDKGGYYYGGGIVFGPNYPTTDGAFETDFAGGNIDAGITKYNPTGTDQVYSTYLGGNGEDNPHSMIINSSGQLIVYGSTSSSNFPVTAGAYDQSHNSGFDIYITKFSSDGESLVSSTYIGGSSADGRNEAGSTFYNYGDGARGEVIVDDQDNVYVASSTNSNNFPTTPGSMQTTYSGSQDGVAFKLNSTLSSLEWSTYVGGSNDDAGYGIKVTPDDAVVVCGGTSSSNFPTTAGSIHPSFLGGVDGFVVNVGKFNGSLNQSTFLGTPAYDQAYFIDFDENSDIYIMGQTQGAYPVSTGVYSSGGGQFIHKISPDLSTSYLSTVFGTGVGTINISPTAFLVDDCSNIYVSGWGGGLGIGSTSGMPITPLTAIQPDTDGEDFYFIVIQKDFQSLLYGTFYGGFGTYGEHVDGGTSRFDKHGIIYQGICACGAASLPTTPGAWSSINGDNCNLGSLVIDVGFSGVFAEGTAEPDAFGCVPYIVDFQSFSNGVDFIWDFGDESPLNLEENPSHEYLDVGVYDVTFIAIDSALCIIADTTELVVTVYPPSELTSNFSYSINCEDNSITVFSEVSGVEGMIFEWDMGAGFTLYSDTVTMNYGTPGTYTITLIATDTICGLDSVVVEEITISEMINAGFDLLDSNLSILLDSVVCSPFEINTVNNSDTAANYYWDFGDGSPIVNEFDPSHTYSDFGYFTISLIIVDSSSCNISDTLETNIEVHPGQYTADIGFTADCEDGLVSFSSLGTMGALDSTLFLWDFGDGSDNDNTENPEHIFSEGLYLVKLIVYDNLSCSLADTVIMPLDVYLGEDMEINFEFVENCVDSSVTVTNTGTTGNSIINYLWNMGDDSTYTTESVSHYYNSPGTYQVTFQLINTFCDDVIELIQEVYIAPTIVADFTVSPGIDGCSPYQVQFLNTSNSGFATSYFWDFGNSLTSNDMMPVTIYDASDFTTYDAILFLTDPESCNLVDSQMVQIDVSPAIEVDLIPDSAVCKGETVILDAGNPGNEFAWSPGGEDTQTIEVSTNNVYSVVVNNAFCIDSSSVKILIYEHPILEYNATGCSDPPLVLNASETGSDYMWSTGETTASIAVIESGIYWNSYLDSNNCARSDTIDVTITEQTDQIFAPNSFSPNGDNLNDTWRAYGGSENEFEVFIFDRWGKMMWESKNIDDSWDGKYKGSLVPAGVYVYRIYFYSACHDKKIETSGSILVIR
jgi:gliding motility-associated-like protein